jgi:hypothetical protein
VTEAPKVEAPSSRAVAVLMPNKKAMQVEVGARLVENLADIYNADATIAQQVAENDKKRYDTLAQMTMGVVKAAKADPTIGSMLPDVFSGDQKKINALNEVLQIALGIREVIDVQTKQGGKVQKVQYVKGVMDFFPTPNDTKGTPEHTKKTTLRSNFLHQLKKSIQGAHGIIEKQIDARIDSKSGTLLLQGPAVKKHFGQDKVILDERQNIKTGEGDKATTIKLAARPSFSEIAKIGATASGRTVTQRADSRANVVTDADTAIVQVSDSLVRALNNYKGKMTDKLRKSLASAANAIVTFSEKHKEA